VLIISCDQILHGPDRHVEDVRKLMADRPDKRLEKIERGMDTARHSRSAVMEAFKVKVSRTSFQVR